MPHDDNNESLFTINLSDSEYWISSKLNKSFSDRITQGHIKRLQVIQVKDCTGDLNSGFIDIGKICRPKSLQVDNPVVFGNPIPLVSTMVNSRNPHVCDMPNSSITDMFDDDFDLVLR